MRITNIEPMKDLQTRTNKISFKSILKSETKLKEVKNVEELLHIFKKNNLTINPNDLMKFYISELGYYHISGYRRVFLDSYKDNRWSGKFNDDVRDDFILNLINIDNELSRVLLKYTNKIERRLKSRSAYFLSTTMGEDFHLHAENFESTHYWENHFKKTYIKVLSIGEKEENPVVLHHEKIYDGKLPIWVFFEHISFGDYLKFMRNLKLSIKNETFDDIFNSSSNKYPIKEYMSNAAILDFLSVVKMVRNRISHLGRIYDWKFHYIIGNKGFTEKFNELFGLNKNDFTFYEIIKIFGFFLYKEQHEAFMEEIIDVFTDIKDKLPLRYSQRILSDMGYHFD